MAEREALQAALELYRNPMLARSAKRMPLPKNVRQVIRIAAGEALDSKSTEATFGWTEADVRAAAVFYLQHVLFDKHSGDYRLLGLSQDATEAEIKDHKRALLKWLHPDRNANKWESALFKRVVKASENLSAANNVDSVNSHSLTHLPSGNSNLVPEKRSYRRRRRGPEAKRVRQPLYWRQHFLSFAKRIGIVTAALSLIVVGFRAFADYEHPMEIIGLAQEIFAWSNSKQFAN